MEWFVIIVLIVVIYFFYRSRSRRANLSMLPEQFVVIDIETTGLDPSKHEIIEIGAVRVRRDSDKHTTFQSLIKPHEEIPKKITQITGIDQELIEKEGEDLESVLNEFVEFIGDLRLVAYNAEFDMDFLRRATEKYGLSIKNPYSCALKMARRAWPGLRSYKLSDLAGTGGLYTEGHHRTLKDCELTITVYTAAASKLGTAI